MTSGVSGRRRRAAVSLPVVDSDPVEQLDLIVETVHHINRALPRMVLGRAELLAVGGLLIQINGALLTFTDLLGVATHHCDRARLQDCRGGVLAAYNSARAFHADVRRRPWTGARRGNGEASSESKS